MPEVSPRGDAHAKECRLGLGRAQTVQIPSQSTPIERRGGHGSPPCASTRQFSQHVRLLVAIHPDHAQLVPKEPHHRRGCIQKRLNPLLRIVFSHRGSQERPNGILGFDDAGLCGQRVARNPEPAAGPCTRAAELSEFFQNQNFQPVMGRRDGGCQTRRARADNDDIEGIFIRRRFQRRQVTHPRFPPRMPKTAPQQVMRRSAEYVCPGRESPPGIAQRIRPPRDRPSNPESFARSTDALPASGGTITQKWKTVNNRMAFEFKTTTILEALE